MANGIEMSLASKKSALFSQYRRAAGCGDPGVGQPVERDVVEQVVAREVALQPAFEDLLHQAGLTSPVAVVERERREIDGRVRQSVQRLRTRRHDLRVAHVLRVEGAQLLVRAS